MNPETILPELKSFLVKEVLDNKDIGLDASTPLLQWGLINSLSMMALINFIEKRFGLRVPDEELVPQNFDTLGAITELVRRLPPPNP